MCIQHIYLRGGSLKCSGLTKECADRRIFRTEILLWICQSREGFPPSGVHSHGDEILDLMPLPRPRHILIRILFRERKYEPWNFFPGFILQSLLMESNYNLHLIYMHIEMYTK